MECSGDGVRKPIAKRWRKRDVILVAFFMAWFCWDTVQEIRVVRLEEYYLENPSHLVFVFAVALLIGGLVKLVHYVRHR